MRLPAALAIAFATLAAPASAHEFSVGQIAIAHPYLTAAPPGAKTGAGYMVLTNGGDAPDRLLRIETEAAAAVEFHQTVVTDGVASMRPVEGGIELPPGGEYRLGADGSHAMLVGLKAPIQLGQIIDATLVFEKAGPLPITFEVEPIGTKLERAGEADAH